MKMRVLEAGLRRAHGLPDTFHFFRYEHCAAVEPPKGSGRAYLELEGKVCPLKTAGRYKGEPNYRAGDKATAKTFRLLPEEVDAYTRAYELETGQCYNCEGTREEWAGSSWHPETKTSTHRMRACCRCKGTGAAPVAPDAEVSL